MSDYATTAPTQDSATGLPEGVTVKKMSDSAAHDLEHRLYTQDELQGVTMTKMDAPNNSVFDQDNNRTLGLPQTISETETGYLIKRDVDKIKEFYAMQPVGGFEALGKGISEAYSAFATGQVSGVIAQPQVIGGLMKEQGELIAQDKTTASPEVMATSEAVKSGISKFFSMFGIEDASGKIQKSLDETMNGEEMVRKAILLIDRNKKYMADAGMERPEEGGLNGVMYDMGQGTTSLLAALGLSALTRTPATAGLYFGAMQKSSVYQEARAAGKDPTEAADISSVAGMVEGGLEFVGLDHFIKAIKGNSAVTRFVNGFLIEATQEGSQQAGEEAITTATGVRKESWQDAAKAILYSSALGGVIGGGTSASLGVFAQNEAEKQGVPAPVAKKMGEYVRDNVEGAKTNMTEFIDKELAPIARDDESAMKFMTLMQQFGNDADMVNRDSLSADMRAVFDKYVDIFNKSTTDKSSVAEVEKNFFDAATKNGVDKDQATAAAKIIGARADAASRALGISPMEWLKSKRLSITTSGKKENTDLTEAKAIKQTFKEAKSIRNFNREDPSHVQRKLGMKEKPKSVLQFIKSKGGISLGLTSEELNNVKAARKSKGKSASKSSMASGELKKVFDGKNNLGQYVSEKGMALDDLYTALVDAGYIEGSADEYENQAVDHSQEVLDLIEKEASGKKVYPVAVEQALEDQRDTRGENIDHLNAIGIDDSMSEEEIAQALKEYRTDITELGSKRQGLDAIDDEILFQGKHDGDTYFSENALNAAKDQNDKSRDILIYMSPDDFINVAMSGQAKEKSERVSGVLKSGEKFSDVPFIGFTHDGEGTAVVTSHEGRHRARALKELGVKEMPVLFKSRTSDNGSAIRWGSQQKENPDRLRDEWPKKLFAEVGDSTETSRNKGNNIPFPISRSEATTLFQNDKNPQGQVTFKDDNILIHLFEGANPSTLMHELGHVFLRDMRDVAKVTNRPRTKADYEAVKKWLGAKGDTLTVAQEEKFARGFEAYLREGKAPKPELQSVFDTFKKWLESVYKSVQQLNVKLTPEIREVFDRMLGGDFAMSEKLNQDAAVRNIEADYERIANMEPASTLPEDTKSVFKSVSDLSADAFVPVSTRLGNIDAGLKHAVRKFIFNTGLFTHEDRVAIKPFIEKVSNTFSEQDYRVFDLALKNRDTVKVDFLVDKYGIQQEWQVVREVLDALYNDAAEVGLDLNYIEEYFPRKVKRNMAGEYMAAMRGSEEWSEIETAMKEADPNGTFTPEDQAIFVNSYLRGFSSSRINLARPSYTKERTVDYVTPDFNRFYQDSMPTLMDYIGALRHGIESRKLFGKSEIETDENIGSYVLGLVEAGIIKHDQELELKKLLKAVVEPTGSRGAVAWAKNASYVYLMGSPLSAITQIQDLAFSLHHNGYYRTTKSLLKSLTGNQVLKKEDLGVDNILREFEDETRANTFVRGVFKLVGLEWMDNVGKETYIDAGYSKLVSAAKKGGTAFDAQMETVFGDEAEQTKQDLLDGTMSENVKYLLFSELSDVQPISLAEMPVSYLNGGNGRVFYMLKTYTLKQLDIYRREIFANIFSTDVRKVGLGLKNLVSLGAALMAMGMGSDALKDLLLGRDFEVDDLVTDNMLKLLGFSKYQIYQAKTEGIGNAVLRTLFMPPVFAPVDDVGKDIKNIVIGKENKRTGEITYKDWKDAEVLGKVPVVGKFYYWWWGGGNAKLNKKTKVSTP